MSETFADPAWDLLLDLYIAWHSGANTSVTAACAAAYVPQSTGLRYLDKLVESGLVTRLRHPRDKRTYSVALTSSGLEAMNKILAEFADLIIAAGIVRRNVE
ncbi:MarR family transcriptional regulator [Novosphingobium album (ex Liu et al. 2023)]|uniref:MarR family transcriptional regulator n=1 Tax=Novosphingobium album (ex Liu et al. 2023) TaxID=3031130 RepID=A0ABT5WQX9_9SPHN|nr:MarR family transcriptional regulator [Novosphingobium album (ex Liu et al. 2023)]MDE8652259.1 MarR family transcriptional regulator [Novosphingobium album (ex Liu et al. 2023)]